MGRGKPFLPNVEAILAAGLDPKSGLPIKMSSALYTHKKEDIKRLLRIKDEQDAVNRYTWYNLPEGLSSQELERMLYYKGQLCFFEFNDKYYFMPYALSGTIDYYGRFNTIHPVPMSGGSSDTEKEWNKTLTTYFSTVNLTVIKDVELPEDYMTEDGELDIDKVESTLKNSAVIIRDYTNQLSQSNVPRQILNEGIIDIESDCIPFMRTALLNATGVMAMRVSGQEEQSNVDAASRAIDQAALNGQKYVPVVGALDFQELTNGTAANAEEFLLAMQSLDNFRLSTYGLDNAGLFQKSQYVTDGQSQVNAGNVGIIMQDGLTIRQHFCNIVNSVWGLGIWCEVSETVTGMDADGNGIAEDETEADQDTEGFEGEDEYAEQ